MLYSTINFESEKSNLRKAATIFAAALAAFTITYIEVFFAFSELEIKDRGNYRAYEAYAPGEMIPRDYTIVISEPFFYYFYAVLGAVTQTEGQATKLLIFISSFGYFSMVLLNSRIPLIWRFAICLFPWSLTNYIMTLRLGAGSLVIFLHVLLKKKIPFYAWVIAAGVHYAFFILASLAFTTNIVSEMKFSTAVRALLVILSIGFVILPVLMLLSGFSGGHLPDYFKLDLSNIGFAFIYWAVVLVLFIAQGRQFVSENLLAVSTLITYLVMLPFFSAVSRVMQIAAIFVLFSGFQLTGARLGVFKALIFLHVLYFLFGIFSTQTIPGMVK